MGKLSKNIPSVGNADFDWDLYEDGWNGKTLKPNKKVKTVKGTVVYSHETYAVDAYKQYARTAAPVSKELRKDILVSINDFKPIDKDTVLASINGGSNNIVIDLNKEGRFFNTIAMGEQKMTKEMFLACLNDPEVRKKIVEMNLVAKIGTDIEKASIWDGYVENLSIEMREQITLNNKAYIAKVLSSNNGGFVVEIANTVKAFMPGSMAAANKLTNYEALVGTELEVMVESYDKKLGFVVSRKKYLRKITPKYLAELSETLNGNADTVFEVKVTGTTPFGVFCEMNEVLTGMVHKSLMSDSLREALRQNSIKPDTTLNVYVHKIEKGRIILSDVPSAEREAVIAKREAEDAQEKTEYTATKTAPVVSADKLTVNSASKEL